jgi:hypothetical protein
MTKVRLSGFPDGSNVSLSAVKGSVTRGPVNVSAWKQAATGDMTISVTKPKHALIAPAAIWFEADVTGDTGLDKLTNGQDREGNVLADARYDKYDQQFHELEFEWSFGDTGTWGFASRLPTQLQQRDYGHGKVIAHVFSTPGDKTVTCTAYRMGVDGSGNLTRTTVATKTITFEDGGDYPTIQSWEDAIPLARRMYYDPTGAYDTIPAGAKTPITESLSNDTITMACRWAESQSTPDPVAILVRRGTSETTDTNRIRLDHPNVYVGTYGTGDRPQITCLDSGFGTGYAQYNETNRGGFVILDGFEVIGNWDVENESGGGSGGAFGGQAVQHHLAHDCVFRDMAGAIISGFLGDGQGIDYGERSLVICDSELKNWQDYGMIVQDGRINAFYQDVAIIGCKIHHQPDSSQGINGKTGFWNTHGPVRIESAHHICIRASDLYSRVHWDALCQPCIRVNTVSPQQWDLEPGRTSIYGNALEGGNVQIISSNAGGVDGLDPVYFPSWETVSSSRAYTWPLNILIKHNLLLGSFSVSTAVISNKSCVSLIENVFLFPDVQRWASNDVTSRKSQIGEHCFSVEGVGEVTVSNPDFNGWVADLGDENGVGLSEWNTNHPGRVIGNTIIDLKTTGSADDKTIAGSTLVSNLVGLTEERDNTLYAPNYTSTPVTSTGPWDFVENIPPLETFGVRHDMDEDGTYTELTSYATPSDGLKLYRPASNAAIANAATGPASYRDFFGTVRTTGQKATKGAMEPES